MHRFRVGALILALLLAPNALATYTSNGSAADQAALTSMLTSACTQSADFKSEYDTTVADTGHSIRYDVGRSQGGVLIDAYGSNAVDLDDLSALPVTPPAGHPNALTQSQALKHIMAERWYKATLPCAEYLECHEKGGMVGENALRSEAGQSPVVKHSGTPNPGGGVTVTITYGNGGSESWTINSAGNITAIAYH